MDQFYYESGYVEDNYFVYTAEAELTGLSESSISCDASVIAGGVAVFGYGDIESFASITATISHINGADLFAFSEATLAVAVDRIRSTNLEATASFSTAIDAVRGIYVSAQADSAFDIAVANLRVRNTEAAVEAAFSLAMLAGMTYDGAAELTSTFEPSLVVDAFKNSTAVLESSTGIEATATTNLTAQASLVTSASSTAIAKKTADSAADISLTASLAAEVKVAANQWLVRTSLPTESFIASTIATDSNDNIYAVSDESELTVVKYNKYGEVQWQYTYGTTNTEAIQGATVAPDGNLYLVGSLAGQTAGFLLKISSLGSIVWAKQQATSGQDATWSVSCDASSNIYISGYSNGTSAFIAKYNPAGTVQYTKIYNAGTTAATNLIVKGSYLYTGSSGSGSITKANLDGSSIAWSRANTSLDYILDIAVDNSGNVYATGYDSVTPNSQTMIKYNSSGTRQWTMFNQDIMVNALVIDAENNIIALGYDNISTRDLYLAKYSPEGQVIWAKKLVGSATEPSLGRGQVKLSSQGDIVFGGYSNFESSYYNSLVGVFAPNGSGELASGFTYVTVEPTISFVSTASTDGGRTLTNGGPSTSDITASFTRNSLATTSELIEVLNTGVDVRTTAALTQQASASATASKLINLAASLASTTALTASSDSIIKNADASLSMNGFVTSIIGKIIPEFAGLESTSTLIALVGIIKQQSSSVSSRFTLTANALDLDLAQANLSSTITLSAVLSPKYLGGVALLQSTATVLANVSENPNLNVGLANIGFTVSFQVFIPSGVTKSFGAGFSTDDILAPLGYVTNEPTAGSLSIAYASGTSYAQLMSTQFQKTTTNKGQLVLVGAGWSIPTSFLNSLPSNTWFTVSATLPGAVTPSAVPSGTSLTINGTTIETTYTQVVGPLANPAGPTFGLALSPSRAYVPAVEYVPASGSTIQYRNVTYSPTSQATYRLITTIASADLASVSTLTFTPLRVKIANAVLTSRASVTAVIGKRASGNNTMSSTSTMQVVAKKTSNGISSATSALTQVASPVKTYRTGTAVTSTSTLVANVARVRLTSADFTSVVVQSASAIKTASIALDLTTTSSLSLTALRIQQSAVAFDAFVTELSIINKIGQGFIHMDATSSLVTDPVKSTEVVVTALAETTAQVQAKSVLFAASTITSTTSLTADVVKLRRVEANISTTTELTANPASVVRNSAELNITSSQATDTNNSLIRTTPAALTATTEQQTDNQIVRLASSNMQALTTQATIAGVSVRFEIHMQAFDTQLTAGQVLHIDPYNQLKIKGETRYLTVLEETREITIKQETRVNKIRGLKQ